MNNSLMPRLTPIVAVAVLVVIVGFAASAAQPTAPDAATFGPADWPCWRGPTCDGIANPEQQPPLKWSETENILWKSPVPGRGHGSPIIVGERIFLATADHETDVQSLACYERGTGKLLWSSAVHKGGFTKGSHVKASNPKSSYASSTPACDGKRVFINFFNVDAVTTTALDLDGKQLWQTKVSGYVMHQGFCSSPMIYHALVLVSTDNKGGGVIAELDRATGEIVWKQERPKMNSYASPIVLDVAGRPQLVLGGCERITSLDPATGSPLWEIPGSTIECVTSTVTDGKNVIISGGWPRGHTSAIRGDGSGKIVWENKTRSYVPSMLASGGHLYAVNDDGIVTCWKCATGEKAWSARFEGPFSASLVLVGERIYATNEAGRTYVFRATPEKFDLLAENWLGDNMLSTSAICGGRIYMRGAVWQDGRRQEMLYCVGELKSTP